MRAERGCIYPFKRLHKHALLLLIKLTLNEAYVKLSIFLLITLLLVSCSKSELEICIASETSKELHKTGLKEAFENVDAEIESYYEKYGAYGGDDESWRDELPSYILIEKTTSTFFIESENSELYKLIENKLPKSYQHKAMNLVPAVGESLFGFLYSRAGSIAFEKYETELKEKKDAVYTEFGLYHRKLTVQFAQEILTLMFDENSEELCNTRGIYK